MRITRALPWTAGLVAVCAGVLTPAQAAGPSTAPGALYAQTNATTYEPGCVASAPYSQVEKLVPTTGQAVSTSFDRTITVAKPGEPATVVDLDGSATAKLVAHDGRFRSFDLAARGRTAISVPAGQTCSTDGYGQLEFGVRVTFTRAQWLTTRTSTGPRTTNWVHVYRIDVFGQDHALETQDTGGASSATWYLPPGTYQLDAALNWRHRVSLGGTSGEHAGTGSVHLETHDAGGAIATAAGAGRSYLTPGAAISCGPQTLPTTFTSRGGRVKSATYYVNGVQKRVVRNPVAGQEVTLTGMPKYRRNDVRVRLVVDPPGDVRSATVAVTRSYRACSPMF